jgi:hypothetical protein
MKILFKTSSTQVGYAARVRCMRFVLYEDQAVRWGRIFPDNRWKIYSLLIVKRGPSGVLSGSAPTYVIELSLRRFPHNPPIFYRANREIISYAMGNKIKNHDRIVFLFCFCDTTHHDYIDESGVFLINQKHLNMLYWF